MLLNINSKNHHGFHSPSVASSASENAVDLTSHFHSFSILWFPSLHSMTYSGPCHHHRSPVGLLSLLPLPPTHLYTATKITYLKSAVFISLHLQFSGSCLCLQASLSPLPVIPHALTSLNSPWFLEQATSGPYQQSWLECPSPWSPTSQRLFNEDSWSSSNECARRHCSGFWGCNSENCKHSLLIGSPSSHWHSGLVETIG